MYTVVLAVHSWLRWAAIVCGIAATITAISDADVGGSSRANRWGLFFMMTLDLQMLVGLILYLVLSPITAHAMSNFDLAMRDGPMRFWAFTHAGTMMTAVVLAHVGRVLARKTAAPE